MVDRRRTERATLPSVEILGCRVHRLTMAEAVAEVCRLLEAGGGHQVVTADSSALVIAQSDEEFRGIVNGAALVTPDSMGVVWASRLQGTPVPSRVPGVDLMDRLCQEGARSGRTAFFFGAAPGVAEEAARRLQARYPGFRVVGTRHGYFQPADEPAIAREIRAAGPDLLFVALGIPKQEKFIARWLRELQVPVCVGVGGSLDCFSGRVKRAPRFFQQVQLEWLYRLLSNPRKAGKVALLPRFMLMVLRDRWRPARRR